MKKFSLLSVFLLIGICFAQIPKRPTPERLYTNLSQEFPDFLSSSESQQLEDKLEQFSRETSNQICVVVVDELAGYELADYTIRLANDWGIGKKGSNNGIVLLVKPTKRDEGRKVFIAVGSGLEGAIPDLATKRILEQEVYPRLKAGNYFEALDKGTEVLMQLAKGEINVKDYTKPTGGKFNLMSLIIAIVVIIILINKLRGGGGGRTYSRAGRSLFWGGAGFGGGSWGGGGSSSSGGGFGGFGGGSFGGGGSGGSW